MQIMVELPDLQRRPPPKLGVFEPTLNYNTLLYFAGALTSAQAWGCAILASPTVTINAEVTMVIVHVAMVTGLVAMETGAVCRVATLRSRDT